MKKYMLVCQGESGKQYCIFADSYNEAHDLKMDAECGMGAVCEVYERTADEDGVESYMFLFS